MALDLQQNGNGSGAPNPSGQPAENQPAPQNQDSGQSQQQTYPWESVEKFKGKGADDVWKSYTSLESQLGDLGPKAKVADTVNQYGGVDNLLQWAQYGARLYQEAQTRQNQPQQQPQQQPGQAADPYEQWDVLSPREQARLLSQQVEQSTWTKAQQYVNGIAQQYAQAIQADREQMSKQWDIYRQVMNAWRQNPKLDPDQILRNMAQVATGNVSDLINIASRNLTGEEDMEARAQAKFEAWKQAEEQKVKNSGQNVLTALNRPSFSMPDVPKTKNQENALIAKRLIEAGIPPGAF